MHKTLTQVLLLLLFVFFNSNQAFAVGEASTKFNLFVPPNDSNNGRDVFLIVTAVNGSAGDITTVNIVDDGADGDTDDTYLNVKLTKGQSYLVRLKDGAVNDDAGGKWDGDYFKITSDRPVVVQMSTKSNWQHDWVPADNKKMIGHNFFIYSPPSSGAAGDINLYAYTNNTTIAVYDITVTPKSTTGATSVSLANATKILEVTLNEGQDLIATFDIGSDILEPGRSYYIQSTYPVTAQYGHLSGNSSGTNHSRDGGGFVPSSNGSSVGELFYFMIPHNIGNENEKELRIISYDSNNTVNLYGWGTTTNRWELISSQLLNANNSLDFVGAQNATFKKYKRYKLTCSNGKKVALFEANWLETGSIGTSDVASSVSSSTGSGAGTLFISYMGPPGTQTNTASGGTYSHLFIYSNEVGTTVSVVDSGTGGTYFSKTCNIGVDEYCDIKMNTTEYNTLNTGGRRPYLTVSSNKPVAVVMTNWNDNWMTYATSVLLPTPNIDVSAAKKIVDCGTQVTVSFSNKNIGTAGLTSPETEVTIPEGLDFVSSSGDLGTLPTVQTINGFKRIVYSGYTQNAGQVFNQSFVLSVTCQKDDLSYYASGKMINVDVVGKGTYNSTVYTTQNALVLQLRRNNFISALSARNGGNKNIVSWSTNIETDNTGFAIFRSTHPVNSFVQINGTLVASKGNSLAGHSYFYNDTTTTNGKRYFYKIVLYPASDPSIEKGPVSAIPTNEAPPTTPILSVSAGNSVVQLNYSVADPTGIQGYILKRSQSPTGPFVALHSGIRVSASYVDFDVINGILYHYQVVAVSGSGVESDPSNIASATPSGAISESEHIVAYEDMIGDGNNDWDYNDFVSRVKTNFTLNGSNQVSQVRIEIEALARGASNVQQYFMKIPGINGYKSYTLDIYSKLGGSIVSSTSGNTTGDLNLLIWDGTRKALPEQTSVTNPFSTNTSSDVSTHKEGQVAVLTIVVSSPTSNPLAGFPAPPFDGYLKIPFKAGQPEVHRHSYCSICQESVDSPVFSPASLYSHTEFFGANMDFTITIPKNETNFWKWGHENRPIWETYSLFSPDFTNPLWYLTPDNTRTWQHWNP